MQLSLGIYDIMAPDQYECGRAEVVRAILELRRRRRVALGTFVSLSFENRATVLFQIQEVVRAEGIRTRARLEQEIAEYGVLVPRGAELTATLMIHGGSPRDGLDLGRSLADRAEQVLALEIGSHRVGAELVAPAPDPGCPVHYLRFSIDRPAARDLADLQMRAGLRLRTSGTVKRAQLSTALRRELTTDLSGGHSQLALGPKKKRQVNHLASG
jgi:hypothetical protein